MTPAREYRCSTAARWMPRTLGASVLVSAYIASEGMDPTGTLPGSDMARTLVIVFGAALALWIVRAGGEVRLAVTPEDERLAVRSGKYESGVAFMDVTALHFRAPFEKLRQWLPALVLVDRFEIGWRIPGFIEGGEELLETILERIGRDEIRTWAEARHVARSMRRARFAVPVGYALAAVALVSSIVYTFF